VDSYRYLGIEFSRTGTFFKAKKVAYDQAQRAMFSLIQVARKQDLPVSVVLDLFQKMVIPVLLYGCEIRGYESLNILDKLQNKFLKNVFHLGKSTMTNMILGETGLFPLSVLVKSRLVNFWAGLVQNETEKMSCRMYRILFDLHINNYFPSEWLTCVKETLIQSGFDCVWDRQSFSSKELFCNSVKDSLREVFIQTWKDSLNNSSKCVFYKNFKNRFW